VPAGGRFWLHDDRNEQPAKERGPRCAQHPKGGLPNCPAGSAASVPRRPAPCSMLRAVALRRPCLPRPRTSHLQHTLRNLELPSLLPLTRVRRAALRRPRP
jgi:hypothetical protein